MIVIYKNFCNNFCPSTLSGGVRVRENIARKYTESFPPPITPLNATKFQSKRKLANVFTPSRYATSTLRSVRKTARPPAECLTSQRISRLPCSSDCRPVQHCGKAYKPVGRKTSSCQLSSIASGNWPSSCCPGTAPGLDHCTANM